MNMVASSQKIPSAAANCDRYGHPLRDAAPAVVDAVLGRYLSEREPQVTERWSQLYRKLYDDRGAAVPEDQLVDVIQATLRSLCEDASPAPCPEGTQRFVQRRICLAGWECHGYLVPTQDWQDREDLGAVRSALKRKLLVLLDRLIA